MTKISFRKTSITIAKILLVLPISYIGLASLVASVAIFYSFISPLFSSHPNEEEAKKSTATIFEYYLLEDLRLVYSIKNWNRSSDNVCFVFSYPKNHYIPKDNLYSYLNPSNNYDNDNFLREFNREVSDKANCTRFISKLSKEDASLFKEHDYHYEYGRGGKVFLNEEKNLIMFEGYLYD